MGTTINGVYNGGKQARRERALIRLKNQVIDIKAALDTDDKSPQAKERKELSEVKIKDLSRIQNEIKILEDRLSGKKRTKRVGTESQVIASKEKWFIDIFQIHLGYVKNSDRRKNKGKSKKKMKKVRNRTFVKSVIMQPGMMQNYRDGKMGISPKNHAFVARKEEPDYFN